MFELRIDLTGSFGVADWTGESPGVSDSQRPKHPAYGAHRLVRDVLYLKT